MNGDNAAAPTSPWQMGWYNGWSPDERRAAAAIQREAVTNGRLPAPTRCSVCGHMPHRGSTERIWFHDENYADPLAAFPICRRCHLTLHERFDRPEPWLALVQAHASGGCWFEALSIAPASTKHPFATTYPNGLPAI